MVSRRVAEGVVIRHVAEEGEVEGGPVAWRDLLPPNKREPSPPSSMSTQKEDSVATPSADPQDQLQPTTPQAGAAADPTAAAASFAATSTSWRRAPPQHDDGDELRSNRVRLQQRIGAVGLGMARAAAVASRSVDEAEEQRKRRREQKAACERKRRRAAADEDAASEAEEDGESGDEGESEGESEVGGDDDAEYTWVPPSEAVREEARARWRGEDDTAEYERLQAERRADEWSASGQPFDGRGHFSLPFAELERRVKEEGLLTRPGDDQAAYDARVYRDRVARGVPLGEYLTMFYSPDSPDDPPPQPTPAAAAPRCPHGRPLTDDWLLDGGQPAPNWSSICVPCLAHQLAVRACAAACATAAAPSVPEPPDAGSPPHPPSPPLPESLHAAGDEQVLPMPQLCSLLAQLSRPQLQERLDRLDACISAAVMAAQAAGKRHQTELRAKAVRLGTERYAVREQQLKCPNCGAFSCGQVAGWACSRPQPPRDVATTWRAPDGTRHGKLPAAEDPRRRRTAEEPEPDWAPYATVDGKVLGKSSDFYCAFDGAAATRATLMMHSASADPSALYRWLEDPPAGQPRVPPPSSLPPPPTEDGPVVDGPPPRRSAYRRGKKGRRIFHRERAEWYERATGERLEGSPAEQHARFNAVTRRYRAYTDR